MLRNPPRLPPLSRLPVPTTRSRPPRKTKKKKNKSNPKSKILERTSQYDVAQELTDANSGLTVGQLLRGDAIDAQKEMKKLFKNSTSSRAVGTIRPSPSGIPRVLLVVPVKIFGTEWWALLDTGAVPNIISKRMIEHLSLSPEETQRRITVADGSSSKCDGVVAEVPIAFDTNVVSQVDVSCC